MKKILYRYLLLAVLYSIVVGGCASQKLNLPPAKSPQPLTSPTETNDPTASLTETTSPTAAPSPQTSRIWLAPYLPEDFSSSLSLPDGITRSSSLADVDLLVDVGNENLLGEWIFALAAPFSTLTDSITLADLKEILLSDDSEKFPEIKILVDSNTKTLLEKYFKTTDLKNLMVVPSEKLLSTTWQDKNTWAIFPFEKIEPQWKILDVDGQNPLHKDFISSKYPLAIPFSITGNSTAVKVFFNKKALLQQKPISNRDPEKLTTVVLTGVTALVRATASLMESKGMTYPGEDIRLWLREADITHISNEIAYTPKCPPPFSNPNNVLVFCSRPEYNQLLEDVGTDIVEMSGDHFIDWGSDAVRYTLDLYTKLGWKYYGGGKNLEDGRKPVYIEHNGNKIAFLGCNAKPPGYAKASATEPGAVHCNFPWLTEEIKKVKSEGYIPIVTFQHLEYLTYEISPYLQPDFHRVADAGAQIVSGSQAHQPHGMEFYNGAFLHYGLGNLFFDQYKEGIPERQAFIDRHVFYNGKYINTELLTIMFVDQARPRPMTGEERLDLLKKIFKVSGW